MRFSCAPRDLMGLQLKKKIMGLGANAGHWVFWAGPKNEKSPARGTAKSGRARPEAHDGPCFFSEKRPMGSPRHETDFFLL